jgi:hypothetical protein
MFDYNFTFWLLLLEPHFRRYNVFACFISQVAESSFKWVSRYCFHITEVCPHYNLAARTADLDIEKAAHINSLNTSHTSSSTTIHHPDASETQLIVSWDGAEDHKNPRNWPV